MSDNPTKYEVLIEQYLSSILDISGMGGVEGVSFPFAEAKLAKRIDLSTLMKCLVAWLISSPTKVKSKYLSVAVSGNSII